MPDFSRTGTIAQLSAVVALAIFWAINWPMMKLGLEVVEPWTFRAVLVIVGGVGSLLLAAALGQSVAISRREIWPLLLVGIFQGILWNAFSGFGIALVEAGRASVLAFTMPVWATILSILFLGERLNAMRVAGLAMGMAAMVLLILPALDALRTEAFGSMLMIGGAISWAAATIVVKATNWRMSPLVLAGWQFLIGAVPLTAASFAIGDPATLLDLDMPTAWIVAYSAIIPMIFCQAIFYELVRRLPASIASTGTLLVPPLGVMFSALILGEQVGPAELIALVLVITSMTFILPGFNWRAILHPPPASRPE